MNTKYTSVEIKKAIAAWELELEKVPPYEHMRMLQQLIEHWSAELKQVEGREAKGGAA